MRRFAIAMARAQALPIEELWARISAYIAAGERRVEHYAAHHPRRLRVDGHEYHRRQSNRRGRR